MRRLRLALWLGLVLGARVGAASFPPLRAAHGAVASPHPAASAAGVAVLEAGGDAVDAAIATMATLSVATPGSSGIGGGFFALVHRADEGRTYVLDAREVAPAGASRDMYVVGGRAQPELSRWGGLAVAVPGEVRGYQALHERWGRTPWPRLFQGGVDLALQGMEVTGFLQYLLDEVEEPLRRYSEMKRLFTREGRLLRAGEHYSNPMQAETLAQLGKLGPDWFYKGQLAREMVRTVRHAGGLLSRQDLEDYRVTWREPVRGSFRGHQIVSMPPPSSGGAVLLEILQVLEHFPLESMGQNSSAYLHTLAEALKHGFADRAETMGDPAFVKVPLARLLSPLYARALARRINPLRTRKVDPKRHPMVEDQGTNHLSVVDVAGNVVAATTTINYAFGSLLAVPGRGFLLNDQMDDFSIRPGVPNAFGLIGGDANAVAAGKKPLSSMTPTIVFRQGAPVLVSGGAGGPRIITGTLQTILNVLVFEQDVQEALDAPRIHHQWMPDSLECEDAIPMDVLRALGERGHRVELRRSLHNRVQAVAVTADGLEAATDPREQGGTAGY